jgi:hypothetical protein
MKPQSADRLLPLRAELEFLRATADRSDPLDETLLCLFESTVTAASAAERARLCADPDGARGLLREVLAAARAAVTAATFAVVNHQGQSPVTPEAQSQHDIPIAM